MKKVLLSLTMLLLGVGAWAQIDGTKCYTVTTVARGGWAINDEGTAFVGYNHTPVATEEQKQFAFVTHEGKTYLYSVWAKKFVTKNATLTLGPYFDPIDCELQTDATNNGKYFFKFDDSHIINLGSIHQMTIDGWNAKDAGNIYAITEVGAFDNTDVIAQLERDVIDVTYSFTWNGESLGSQTLNSMVGLEYPDYSVNITLPYGIGVAPKPTGVIEESAVVDGSVKVDIALIQEKELPFKTAENYESIEHWYYLNIRDDNPTYLQYDETKSYIKASDNKASVDAATDKDAYTWAFVGNNPFTGYELVNYKTGETMVLSAPVEPNGNQNADQLARMVDKASATGNTKWIIMSTTHNNAPKGAFYIQHPTATNYAFNRQNYDGGNTLCYWGGRDTGSAIQVVERPMSTSAELDLLIESAKELYASALLSVGTEVGHYISESVTALGNAIEVAESVATATDEDVANLQAAINGLEIILPDPTKFYVLENAMPGNGHATGRKIYVNNSGGMQHEAVTNLTLAHVFQFEDAGNKTFYLKSIDRSTYLSTAKGHGRGQESATAASTADAKKVTIARMNIMVDGNNIVSITPDGGAMIHAQEHASVVVGWNNAEGGASAWKIVEADITAVSHSLAIDSTGWASLYLPFNATKPAGATLYMVTDKTDSKAILTELTGDILPAGVAVLVNATADTTLEFKYTTDSADESWNGLNMLNGSALDDNITEEGYILASLEGVIGFYKAKFNQDENTAFKNNAFKAYLPAAGASGTRFLNLDFGTETSIECIEGVEDTKDAVVYDLAGRRVQNVQKGLYIVNGKKVVK